MENFFIIDTFLLLLRDCLIFLIIDWLGFSIVYARMYYYYFIELKRPWFILNNIVSTELINATRKLFIDSYNSYDWLQDVCRWLDLFQQDRNKNRIATKNVFSCRNPLFVLLLLSLFVFFLLRYYVHFLYAIFFKPQRENWVFFEDFFKNIYDANYTV